MSQKRNDEIMSRERWKHINFAMTLAVIALVMALAIPPSSAYYPDNAYVLSPGLYMGDIYPNESMVLLPNTTVCARFPFGIPTAGAYSRYHYIYESTANTSATSLYGTNYSTTPVGFPSSSNTTFNIGNRPFGRDGFWITQSVTCNYNGTDAEIPGNWYYMRNMTRPSVNVSFITHEIGNISQRISGAALSVNGSLASYSGTTDANGFYNATIISSADYSYIANKTGYANTSGLLGAIGQTGGVVYVPMTQTLLTNASIYLYITDAKTGNFISNSQYGIQNLTSGVWKNGTAASGQVGFASTDGEPGYPIAVGQTLRLAAGAEWYFPDSALITVPAYPVPYIHTIPLVDNRTFYNGTWSLIVTLRDATYTSTPITDATVMIYTGVNTNVPFTATEDSGGTGVYSFVNISASALGRLTASAEGYRDTEEIINIVWNSTQHKTLYMQRIGVLPNTTPTTSPTGGPVTTTTTSTIPTTYTNSTAASNDALNVIWSYLVTFATIGCAIVFMWLFWIFIYEFTGGDVINKLLRRGRGGGRRR